MATDMKNSIHGGFTTLVVTLILLSILVAVSAFIGKVLIADKRLTLNEIEYRVAMAAAEKGIAEAMAALKIDPSLRGLNVISGSFSSDMMNIDYVVDIESIDTGVARLSSEASSYNGTRAVVTVDAAETGMLNPNNGEPPPITTRGTGTLKGTITVVANPNGGGLGVPVSVWSSQPIGGTGDYKTCGLHEYRYRNKCGNSSEQYSNKNKDGGDIIDNDDEFPGTKEALMEYVFGEANWTIIESRASAFLSDCNSLSNVESGFYIVDGDCTISGSVGSKDAPLFIIVRDGKFQMNANSSFYGYAYIEGQYKTADKKKITLNGGAVFNGAMVISDPEVEVPAGTFDMVYDEDVLCVIKVCDSSVNANNPFLKFSYIPGSWKDWEGEP